MSETTEYACLFNRGCDARIAGLSIRSFPKDLDSDEVKAWKAGWLDVQKNWGKYVEERWRCRKIPSV
jgi:hypothetical protein